MLRGILIRDTDDGSQTIGRLVIVGRGTEVWGCWTLEPAWLENKQNVSCIPSGRYLVRRRESKRFGNHWQIQAVPGRSYVLFHAGNYRSDTRGCILPGCALADLNQDGKVDVVSSKVAMNKLNTLMPEEWTLDIVDPVR